MKGKRIRSTAHLVRIIDEGKKSANLRMITAAAEDITYRLLYTTIPSVERTRLEELRQELEEYFCNACIDTCNRLEAQLTRTVQSNHLEAQGTVDFTEALELSRQYLHKTFCKIIYI